MELEKVQRRATTKIKTTKQLLNSEPFKRLRLFEKEETDKRMQLKFKRS